MEDKIIEIYSADSKHQSVQPEQQTSVVSTANLSANPLDSCIAVEQASVEVDADIDITHHHHPYRGDISDGDNKRRSLKCTASGCLRYDVDNPIQISLELCDDADRSIERQSDGDEEICHTYKNNGTCTYEEQVEQMSSQSSLAASTVDCCDSTSKDSIGSISPVTNKRRPTAANENHIWMMELHEDLNKLLISEQGRTTDLQFAPQSIETVRSDKLVSSSTSNHEDHFQNNQASSSFNSHRHNSIANWSSDHRLYKHKPLSRNTATQTKPIYKLILRDDIVSDHNRLSSLRYNGGRGSHSFREKPQRQHISMKVKLTPSELDLSKIVGRSHSLKHSRHTQTIQNHQETTNNTKSSQVPTCSNPNIFTGLSQRSNTLELTTPCQLESFPQEQHRTARSCSNNNKWKSYNDQQIANALALEYANTLDSTQDTGYESFHYNHNLDNSTSSALNHSYSCDDSEDLLSSTLRSIDECNGTQYVPVNSVHCPSKNCPSLLLNCRRCRELDKFLMNKNSMDNKQTLNYQCFTNQARTGESVKHPCVQTCSHPNQLIRTTNNISVESSKIPIAKEKYFRLTQASPAHSLRIDHVRNIGNHYQNPIQANYTKYCGSCINDIPIEASDYYDRNNANSTLLGYNNNHHQSFQLNKVAKDPEMDFAQSNLLYSLNEHNPLLVGDNEKVNDVRLDYQRQMPLYLNDIDRYIQQSVYVADLNSKRLRQELLTKSLSTSSQASSRRIY